ncbi:MAG TPA: AAA family ATPase [Gammaproteobacteria bacterium]|nr:AAA family ATPase [Gammaproteobacteria bacterium]
MQQTQAAFSQLRDDLQSVIIGQSALIDRLIIGLLTGGHLLLEGPPGLAKTTAVKALASGVHANFQRIQFTPDLMPSDITGSDIFDPNTSKFKFSPGPLFNEIVLADEINRAPPKVQSALLEAMGEHQVSVGSTTHELPDLFFVMATQNPLEQMGTYPLPEAQLDRFLLHVVIDYPSNENELLILKRDRQTHFGNDNLLGSSPIQPDTVLKARRQVAEIHVEDTLEKYVVDIVTATRDIKKIDSSWAGYIDSPASPRASISLLRAASALAYLNARDYLIPDDIIEVAPDILRHRIIPSFTARANKITAEKMVDKIINIVPIP